MVKQIASVFGTLALGFASIAAAQSVGFDDHGGAVFVMTNSAHRNEVIAYQRADNGSLNESLRFDTGGRGSGGLIDPLESQGSLVLTDDHRFLLAVNAGSGTVSVFRVHHARLFLYDVVPSGGSQPNALAVYGDLVYVLNAGGTSGVTGFRLNENGRLSRIPKSTRFLSTNTSGAASLAFSPDGHVLAVTERLTNNIDTFTVGDDGALSPVVINKDAAAGTFSIAFAQNGTALVVETGTPGAQNGSTISSYTIDLDGSLFPISVGVPTLGAASCWNVTTPNGRFVYTGNAGTSNVSGFAIQNNGTLVPLPGTVQATNPNKSTNLDMAVSADGKFLYTLNAGAGTIGIFAIKKDGGLANIGSRDGLAADHGLNGIAAF